VFCIIRIQAQDEHKIFLFDSNPDALDFSKVDKSQIRDHPMGFEVAAKLALLNNRYTYVEEATPTSPTNKTIVIKPAIYNSMLKLNRYYKSGLKKGDLELDPARIEFLKYMNIALMLYSENTGEFENFLSKAKNPEDIKGVYDRVELQ
jgi:hypothetical protein